MPDTETSGPVTYENAPPIRGPAIQGLKLYRTIADVNLYRIANHEDRLRNDHYVSLTFGECSDYNAGTGEF